MKRISTKILFTFAFVANFPAQLDAAAYENPRGQQVFGEVGSVEEETIKFMQECDEIECGTPKPTACKIPTTLEEAIAVISGSNELSRLLKKMQGYVNTGKQFGPLHFIANTPEEAEGGILLAQGLAILLGHEGVLVTEESIANRDNANNSERFIFGPDFVATEQGVLGLIRAWNLSASRRKELEHRYRVATTQGYKDELIHALHSLQKIDDVFVVSIGVVQEPRGPYGFYARIRETIFLSQLVNDRE